jgi:hypothetical protein
MERVTRAAAAVIADGKQELKGTVPWVFGTDAFGKTWTRIIGADASVRGDAHVIKQDPVKPSMLYVGTELGLWISLDGGALWAQLRPNNFPSVAVRDLQIHPRAAHAR